MLVITGMIWGGMVTWSLCEIIDRIFPPRKPGLNIAIAIWASTIVAIAYFGG